MTQEELETGLAELEKGFMTPCIYEGSFLEAENKYGETEFFDLDYFSKAALIMDGYGNIVEHNHKWAAYLSASGYMDRTDLTIHETEQEAAEYLVETYCD